MLSIAIAQLNFLVGAVQTNLDKMIHTVEQAKKQNIDVIVFPELSLTGYPPEDLLLRNDFLTESEHALKILASHANNLIIIVGCPQFDNEQLYNCAAILENQKIKHYYKKRILPNYSVFDEQRYFSAGNEVYILEYKQHRLAITICEDIWQKQIIAENKQAGADIIISLNASPYHSEKIHLRQTLISQACKKNKVPLIYANLVGGQDELVFDGASFAVDSDGEIIFQAREFEEHLETIQLHQQQLIKSTLTQLYPRIPAIYQALKLGVRDYVTKNGFRGAILGLSGGIDSALVLAIAVDALGADNVEAVLMPSRYTQNMSNEDAIIEADALGVNFHNIPIENAVNAFSGMLEDIFKHTKTDTTEENIQARCRGVLLMAISNKQGKLLLTTGNKSEMSVGYATLYGDMAGGFAPIKDVPKLLVYELAKYRNSVSQVIPQRVIERPPSAELAPDQIDQDSLPAYDILDPILELYIEQDKSAKDIQALGFKTEDINRAITLVDRNEYKRRQAPPGIKITTKAFGRDRRFPITSGYRGQLK